MDRRTCIKQALWLGAGVVLPLGAMSLVGRHSPSTTSHVPGFNGKIMGTGYSVLIGTNDLLGASNSPLTQNLIADTKALSTGAHNVLAKVDHAMSTWRIDSEISQFNNATHSDWFQVSPATFSVLESALAVSQLSSGAFDSTVGPLVDLWGFGAGTQNKVAGAMKPSTAQVNASLSQVSYQQIDIDKRSSSVRKSMVTSTLDLSGIAKGYAVDQLAAYLDQAGVTHYLVEVGGELRSKGQSDSGSPWRVAIERPQDNVTSAFRVVELSDMAVATSGDYRHYFTHGLKRYSHSIDPRTGHPTDHELASVSVIAPNAMQADALSTALMVMGPEDGLALANESGLAAHFILRNKHEELEEQYSKAFASYIV